MPNLKLGKNNFLSIFIFITFIFLIDRISKILIIKKSQQIMGNEIFSSRYINFELIWNKGIAFGLFSFDGGMLYQMISLLIFFIVIILIYFILKSNGFEKFGFILILGGALGNLFDRIFYKAVPDFIDLHINSFHWFIFNIADIFITFGVICLILVEIFYKKKI
jgi:signal peptidase II|tara:strand:- start:1048 stop:1539 length:492 start_codon:yes stop_codon:yes gene_type:complete